jgi:hypothetical protein
MTVRRWLMVLLALPLAVRAGGPLLVQPAGPGESPAAPWKLVGLPKQASAATRFSTVELDGQPVLRVETQASYGNLVHPVTAQPNAHQLRWRWRLDAPLTAADLRRRDGDDSALRVCAMFDLPMEAVPFIERQVLRIARLRTGEALPAASVCYVWDARLAPGTVLDNVYTRRVRLIVLRGPEAGLQTWYGEQRDLRADFRRLFGDESPVVPPLIGIGIAADADNTLGRSVGHLANIALD